MKRVVNGRTYDSDWEASTYATAVEGYKKKNRWRDPILRILFMGLLIGILYLVTACSSLGAANQTIVQQGDPILMCRLSTCEAYVVQSGLPVPIGQRIKEVDGLCKPLCPTKAP